MATRKTTTAVKTSVKKVVTKGKSTASVRNVSAMKVKESKKVRLGDIRKKVLDPKNKKSLLLAVGIIVAAIIIFLGKGLVVAALVNGQPVSRLSIIHDLEAQSGKAALDAAVTKTLIMQEADKKHITVTNKEINAEMAKITKQFSDQGQNLDQLLATQGLTQAKFRDEVKIQLIVQKILGSKAKVTDKEFNAFLAKNKDLIANQKDQATATANLRQQLEQQKLAQQYQSWIAQLKKDASIQYFVNY